MAAAVNPAFTMQYFSTPNQEDELLPVQNSHGVKKEAHYRYGSVSMLLARRRQLSDKRKKVADIMVALGLFGVLCMVLDTELCIQVDSYDKDGSWSKLIKTLCSLSTLVLLGYSAYFHYVETKIYLIENGMEDWRLYVTERKLFKFVLELIVLAIHPLPGNYDYRVVDVSTTEIVLEPADYNTTSSALPAATEKQLIVEAKRMPIDAMFSVPMFLRVFLIFRYIKLHSKIFEDITSHSLGALNRVKIDFLFIFKAYMQQHPAYAMTLIIVSVFLLLSWSVRACEMYHNEKSNLDDLRDAMWLIAITFLTVGYGDIVPVSYCGRTISVLTGISGAACTALIVAVLTQKLELQREEKYLHAFVTDIEIGKKLRASAACVIQNAWRAFVSRRSLAPDSLMLKHERKVLEFSAKMSKLQEERKSLRDGTITMEEMHQTNQAMQLTMHKTEKKTNDIDSKLVAIEKNLDSLHEKLNVLLKEK